MTGANKKKIGIFCGYYLPHLGGVERYVDKLAPALEALGYQVVIVTSNHDNLPSVQEVGGRVIYRLPIRGLAKERYPIPKRNEEYRKIIRAVEAEHIDAYILNTRFHLTSLVGAKLARKHGRSTLLIEHGTGHFTVNNGVLDFFGGIYEHVLTSYVKRFVDGFYGVSKKCNVWLEHFSIRAKGVFYNAIDPNDAAGVVDHYGKVYPPGVTVIAYAGRLIKEKGIVNLLEAYKDIKQKYPDRDLRLVVAGSGGLFDEIKASYKDPSIEMLGKLDFEHVMALYKRADVFVYPSLFPEGLPSSILEAGLMRSAVVATPKGGTEEVIRHGVDGIITDGSVEDLAQSVGRLLDDPSYAKTLANSLHARVVEGFTWDVVAGEVDKAIKTYSKG